MYSPTKPITHKVTDTSQFLKANSCLRLPKNPSNANFVDEYTPENG